MKHYSKIVEVWFAFYESKFKNKPTFRPMEGKKMKALITNLEKRTIAGGSEWTEEMAVLTFEAFFDKAYNISEWYRNNYTLSVLESRIDTIINARQKDKFIGTVNVTEAARTRQRLIDLDRNRKGNTGAN